MGVETLSLDSPFTEEQGEILKLIAQGKTDKGLVREENEDEDFRNPREVRYDQDHTEV